jgi:hypothetical protein
LSNDEDQLCYKNNFYTIRSLLNDITTNYYIKDSNFNTILHYLIKIENYELFIRIYKNNIDKFNKFKIRENLSKQTPIQIIETRISQILDDMYDNIPNFKALSIYNKKLKFSEIYSDKLLSELRLNNELHKMIPLVKNLFNNMYIIFNTECNDDIFVNIIKNEFKYDELFTYKTNKWNLSNIDTPEEVDLNLYSFIKNYKYTVGEIKKYLKDNEYYKKYWNTITHTLTLYFTNVFYNIVLDLLTNNKDKLGIEINSVNIQNFRDKLFKYNVNYEMTELNLAQTIVVYLYKVKFDQKTIIDNNLSSLIPILKSFVNYLSYPITNKEKKNKFEDHMDKIYNYMNKYFDILKPKITLFLKNYVIFLELHYNLQAIKNELDEGTTNMKSTLVSRTKSIAAKAVADRDATAKSPGGILLTP